MCNKRKRHHNRYQAFTLIEVIVFIVIISIAAALLFPILMSLKYAGNLPDQTVAQQMAQLQMELAVENRVINGFTYFSDPCTGGSPPTLCTAPTGYSASTSIANNWNGDTNYKVITVTVSGEAQATFKQLVANYD